MTVPPRAMSYNTLLRLCFVNLQYSGQGGFIEKMCNLVTGSSLCGGRGVSITHELCTIHRVKYFLYIAFNWCPAPTPYILTVVCLFPVFCER